MLLEAPLPHLLCVTKSLTLNSNDGLLCTIGICKIEIEISTQCPIFVAQSGDKANYMLHVTRVTRGETLYIRVQGASLTLNHFQQCMSLLSFLFLNFYSLIYLFIYLEREID